MGCTASAEKNGKCDEATLEFLAVVPLFKRLPTSMYPKLAACAQMVSFRPGKVIIRQGDEGNEFFVIKSGSCDVVVDGNNIAKLKARDYFGESALLRDSPRTATITASSEVQAIKITRADFRKYGLNDKLDFGKREAVGGGGLQIEVKPPCEKTEEERLAIRQALQANKNLKTMVILDDAKADMLIDKAWKEEVKEGAVLIKQGSLHADHMYVVQHGSFDFKVVEQAKNVAEMAVDNVTSFGQNVGIAKRGDCFGELGILYFAPRAASVVAKEDSVVWVIDRISFKKVMAEYFDQVINMYTTYLLGVKILDKLTDDQRKECAKGLVEMTFRQNEVLFEQDEIGQSFYILLEGQVAIIKNGNLEAELIAEPNRVCYFGESALMKDEPRSASVKVKSETAKTLVLDRMSYSMLVGGNDGNAQTDRDKQFGLVMFADLKRLGLLGCGGFGAVELVEHATTNETYALKALSKGYVLKAGMQDGIMSEKDVQLLCNSSFIVQLFETFNSDQYLYFLLELALGGELYATYNRKGLWGRVDHAKYYIGCVVLAFEHMHSKKIIYRDLKPENVLLTDTGLAKVTDMGLAKICPGMTYTTCGTPDYFAPELVFSKGHTKALDWWTLGVFTFELLGGHPPFEAPAPIMIYQNVTKGINKVTFPKQCRGAAEDFIKGLCHASSAERLPMRKGGIGNVKTHAWFAGFSWPSLESCKMTAPFVPVVKSKKDLANFCVSKDDLPPTIPYKPDKSNWDKNFATSK
eukprot:TRINITY_DN24670_c0_g1_i1.p1 TRINITY_DN24670_c0_g1~~TRINITY_DN24670_c0_g1_i1.p1  ORF type:complete len:750 (-),score=152.43 TRINITY_DN24670_c0_g1_i1:197-2446(-)